MKNDYSFSVLSVIILAGVIVAFASPAHTTSPVAAAAPVTTQSELASETAQ